MRRMLCFSALVAIVLSASWVQAAPLPLEVAQRDKVKGVVPTPQSDMRAALHRFISSVAAQVDVLGISSPVTLGRRRLPDEDQGFGSAPSTGWGDSPKSGLGDAPTHGIGSKPKTGMGGRPKKKTGKKPKQGMGPKPKTGRGNAPRGFFDYEKDIRIGRAAGDPSLHNARRGGPLAGGDSSILDDRVMADHGRTGSERERLADKWFSASTGWNREDEAFEAAAYLFFGCYMLSRHHLLVFDYDSIAHPNVEWSNRAAMMAARSRSRKDTGGQVPKSISALGKRKDNARADLASGLGSVQSIRVTAKVDSRTSAETPTSDMQRANQVPAFDIVKPTRAVDGLPESSRNMDAPDDAWIQRQNEGASESRKSDVMYAIDIVWDKREDIDTDRSRVPHLMQAVGNERSKQYDTGNSRESDILEVVDIDWQKRQDMSAIDPRQPDEMQAADLHWDKRWDTDAGGSRGLDIMQVAASEWGKREEIFLGDFRQSDNVPPDDYHWTDRQVSKWIDSPERNEMQAANIVWDKRQHSGISDSPDFDATHATDSEWGDRQGAGFSGSGSSYRVEHPDRFIMVDRSVSFEGAGAAKRNVKREESDIIWEFLPEGQSRIDGRDKATRGLEAAPETHDGISGPSQP